MNCKRIRPFVVIASLLASPLAAVATDSYVAYEIRPVRKAANELPRNWALSLDDLQLVDGQGDDPENYLVGAARHLLLPAALDARPRPESGALGYLRYDLSEGREGIVEPEAGRLRPAHKHVSRRWDVSTDRGRIVVESKSVAALLVPTRIGESAPPAAVADGDLWKCYQVRVARGEDSDLAPDGRFRNELQTFAADAFRDCSRGGQPLTKPGFDGRCLYEIQKPVEICAPAQASPVQLPRASAATVAHVRSRATGAMLCYAVQLGAKLRDDLAAGLAKAEVYASIEPRPPLHRKRLAAEKRQVFLQPENAFPAPTEVDTVRANRICVPARVSSVTLAP